MNEHIFALWLKETGLMVLPRPLPGDVACDELRSAATAYGSVLSDDETGQPQRSDVADLDLADPEDDDDDDEQFPSAFAGFGAPGDRRENTELVAAVFLAA